MYFVIAFAFHFLSGFYIHYAYYNMEIPIPSWVCFTSLWLCFCLETQFLLKIYTSLKMIDCKLSLHLSSALTLNFRHTLTELNIISINLTWEQHTKYKLNMYTVSSVEKEIKGARRKSEQTYCQGRCVGAVPDTSIFASKIWSTSHYVLKYFKTWASPYFNLKHRFFKTISSL